MMQLQQLGDNVSVSELAEVQGIELPPLMRTLTQLEKRGYLLRTTSPYDKRIRLLTLTPEGKAILKTLHSGDRNLSGPRLAKHRT
jgi:DNA-binding MarR family transcriptional regulator